MNWNRPAAAALLSTLAGGGVRHFVGSPGSRNTPLVLAAGEESQIKRHMVLDERSAGFFALGLAKATREPVVLACTSGTALSHYFPAIIEASLSRIPLLILSADRPGRIQDAGAPQTIRQSNLFGEYTRWAASATAPACEEDARRWRTLGLQALSKALGGEPGPVHLNLPFDLPLWTPEACASIPPAGEWTHHRPRLAPDGAEAFAETIRSIRKGILLFGAQTNDPHEEYNGVLARAASRLPPPYLQRSGADARRNGSERGSAAKATL